MGSEVGDCRHRSTFLAIAKVSRTDNRGRKGKEREISPEKVSWAKKEREGERESTAANLRAITTSRKRNRAKKNGGLKERERNGG